MFQNDFRNNLTDYVSENKNEDQQEMDDLMRPQTRAFLFEPNLYLRRHSLVLS